MIARLRLSSIKRLAYARDYTVCSLVHMEGVRPKRAGGTPTIITRAPLRTVRPVMLRDHSSNPERDLVRLRDAGRLVQIAHGTYTAKPDTIDRGQAWQPPLEEAAMAYATAQFGNRVPVLAGIGAARFHHAIPRAIGVTVIAVPEQHRPMTLQIGGRVIFTRTNVDRLDARTERGALGPMLVTTPEQTLIDILQRPDLGGMPTDALAAATALRDRVDPARVEEILNTRPRTVQTKVRTFLDERIG